MKPDGGYTSTSSIWWRWPVAVGGCSREIKQDRHGTGQPVASGDAEYLLRAAQATRYFSRSAWTASRVPTRADRDSLDGSNDARAAKGEEGENDEESLDWCHSCHSCHSTAVLQFPIGQSSCTVPSLPFLEVALIMMMMFAFSSLPASAPQQRNECQK